MRSKRESIRFFVIRHARVNSAPAWGFFSLTRALLALLGAFSEIASFRGSSVRDLRARLDKPVELFSGASFPRHASIDIFVHLFHQFANLLVQRSAWISRIDGFHVRSRANESSRIVNPADGLERRSRGPTGTLLRELNAISGKFQT